MFNDQRLRGHILVYSRHMYEVKLQEGGISGRLPWPELGEIRRRGQFVVESGDLLRH